MSSVFSQIIAGTIPCYKIYEDEENFGFLDIHPEVRGHVLIVPKLEIDKVYELPDSQYESVMRAVRKMALHLERKLGQRILIKIIGTDVPHAHVHLMPISAEWRYGQTLELTEAELKKLAEQLCYPEEESK